MSIKIESTRRCDYVSYGKHTVVMLVSRNFHQIFRVPLMLVMALALFSCGTTDSVLELGFTRGNPPDREPETDLLSPLGNGLLGNSARQLNALDRLKALQAEYRALEYTPGNKIVSWRGTTSNWGEVKAAQPYRVGSQDCRQYSHSFTVDGLMRISSGTACRNPDGSWVHLM